MAQVLRRSLELKVSRWGQMRLSFPLGGSVSRYHSQEDGPCGVAARERKGHQLALVTELGEEDDSEGQDKGIHQVRRCLGSGPKERVVDSTASN